MRWSLRPPTVQCGIGTPLQAVPGGDTWIVLKNRMTDEGLLWQRSAIREKLAEELGQNVQKWEIKHLRDMDPRQWSTEQLNFIFNAMVGKKVGTNDPVAIARKRIELGDWTVVLEQKAEAVSKCARI